MLNKPCQFNARECLDMSLYNAESASVARLRSLQIQLDHLAPVSRAVRFFVPNVHFVRHADLG